MSDLARRLVASPAWRGWEPGMKSMFGDRVLSGPRPQSVAPHGADREAWGCGTRWSCDDRPCDGYAPCPTCEPELFEEAARLPDLSDPATVGVLQSWLGVADVQWGYMGDDPWCAIATESSGWEFVGGGPTLGEAVAAALIALGGEVGRG